MVCDSQRIERMFAYAAAERQRPRGPTRSRPPAIPTHVTARRTGQARGSAGLGEEERALLAGERLARRLVDLDLDEIPRRREPAEVHDLVVTRAAAQARRVGARRALDEHLQRAPDEPLG